MAGNGVAFSGTKIETFSGGWLDLADPQREVISHRDIAVGLSRVCRFAGQSRWFYSVAEHSVLVARLAKALADDARDQLQSAALIHDASEAYMGDNTAPLKTVMRAGNGDSTYDTTASRLMDVIVDYYGVDVRREIWDIVDRADKWAFVIEGRMLLRSQVEDGYEIPDYILDLGGLPSGIPAPKALPPEEAQMLWIREWSQK
jgi:HD domain